MMVFYKSYASSVGFRLGLFTKLRLDESRDSVNTDYRLLSSTRDITESENYMFVHVMFCFQVSVKIIFLLVWSFDVPKPTLFLKLKLSIESQQAIFQLNEFGVR